MNWTPEMINRLKELCTAGVSNSEIAKDLNLPITQIYAKRSHLGITIDKCRATAEEKPQIEEGAKICPALESFINAGGLCIVLTRVKNTALILRPFNRCCPFVVPHQHIPGHSDWWQGKYFETLESAFAYYKIITEG